jgi:hypothetical protein
MSVLTPPLRVTARVLRVGASLRRLLLEYMQYTKLSHKRSEALVKVDTSVIHT